MSLTAPAAPVSQLRVVKTRPLRTAVRACEEAGYGHLFGRGVPTDPLVAATVPLAGDPVRVARRVELAVGAHLRAQGLPWPAVQEVLGALGGELLTARTPAEFSLRVRSLVREG